MDSIDDIWDAPLLSPSPPPPVDTNSDESDTKISAPRRKNLLFLPDDDDDDVPASANDDRAHPTKPTTATEIDIDAMFADVENEGDDSSTFKSLAPALDIESLRRKAEAKYKNATHPLTPHPIFQSSSPPPDVGDGKDKGKGEGKGKGSNMKDDGPKVRRKAIRLDEGRLLGPTGFPQLIKDTKNFRIKGKGHETTDLNRLLRVYQFWTHRMYPKLQFKDTVERVEKLCHSKRMNVARSVWHDEFHGLINGNQPGDQNEEEDNIVDLTGNEDQPSHNASKGNDPASRQTFTPQSDAASHASPQSRAPSHPPSSRTSSQPIVHTDDDFDIDAIIAGEEERVEMEQSEMAMGTHKTGKDLSLGMPIDMRTEDDAMWNDLEAIHGPPTSINGNATVNAPSCIDEDESMWDVVREMETEFGVAPIHSPLPSKSEAVTTSVVTAPDTTISEVEEDWEDMYL